MLFFNPPERKGGRRVAKRRKKRRRKLTGAALAAHLKKIGKRKRRRRPTTHKRRSRRSIVARKRSKPRRRRRTNPVARRRRRAPAVRHRRRSRRHNPFAVRGVMVHATRGLAVVGGKIITRAAPQLVGLPVTGPVSWAVQFAIAAIGIPFLGRFIGHENAAYAAAGGVGGVYESVIKTLAPNVPIITPALADSAAEAVPAIAAYAQVQAGGMGEMGVASYAPLGDTSGW